MSVTEAEPAVGSLFGRRLARLEQVTILLRGRRRDYAQQQATKLQQKADIYNAHMHMSHGERQGIASAQTAVLEAEALVLKAEIEVLEDERQFLELCVAWDAAG